jgi:hypothetical protein
MKHRDQQIAEARARSRETLAQSERESYTFLRDDGPPVEDAGLAWRRDMEAAERERERTLAGMRRQERQQTIDHRMASIEARLEQKLNELLEQRLADERAYLRELLPAIIVELRKETGQEIASAIDRAYTEALADVRHDLEGLRQQLKKLGGGPEGEIIDLPTMRLRSH